MNEYCLQCSWELGITPLPPRNELKGKLITFTCKLCGHTLVDWEYQCWGECSQKHMELRLETMDNTNTVVGNVDAAADKFSTGNSNSGQLEMF